MMLPILHLTLLPLIIYQTTFFVSAIDPTVGFTCVPLDSSHYVLQKPYDVSLNERYSFTNGVHKFWIYSTDKPFMMGSDTQPRTEIRVTGYDYTSGIRQFEGYGYVPSGSTGVCIQQVFGASSAATTAQLRVYSGSLTYYRSPVLSANIYDRWFRVNVIHDANANNVKVYIDGELKFNGGDNGDGTHYFKFGVYVQNDPSGYMESRWKDIKICRK
ncbi:citrate-binding protein-like [Trifolium pratense]|uniref:citrate-binding protein-like n=1 Tax=Trifolium pratense TaxID=57577 RepID=UPI001E6940B2|nr:citrate-binding protein-like [Trifolium pratense]